MIKLTVGQTAGRSDGAGSVVEYEILIQKHIQPKLIIHVQFLLYRTTSLAKRDNDIR